MLTTEDEEVDEVTEADIDAGPSTDDDDSGGDELASAPTPARARPNRRYWLLLLLPLVVGAGLRGLVGSSDDALTTDGSAYLRSGISIWEGDGFRRDGAPELHFPPVTPFLLGGAAKALDDPLAGTVLVTIVTGVALLVPLAGIARLLGGDRAGLAAAWIAALSPGLIAVPANQGGGSENPFILLVLSAVWAAMAVAGRRDRWLYLGGAAAGVCIGLAYLTRPEGIAYAAIVVPVLTLGVLGGRAALRRRRPEQGWLKRLTLVGLCVGVGAGVFALPYVDYLHTHTGRWEFTAKTRDASLEAWRAVAEGDRRLRDEIFYDLAPDSTDFTAGRETLSTLIKDDPSGYASLVAFNIGEAVRELFTAQWDDDLHLPEWVLVSLPVSLLAAWGVWRGRREWRTWAVVGLGLVTLVAPITFFVQPRYLMPAAAVLCILAGAGAARLADRWKPWVGGVVVITSLVSLFLSVGGHDHFLDTREQTEHQIVGEWLDENTSEDARIITRNLVIEFYANRQMIPMPYESVPRLIEFARDTGTDYIVIDEYQLMRNRPQFIPLFLPGPWPGLKLELEVIESGRLTRVFSLDPPAPADGEGDVPEDIAFVGDEEK